MPVKYVKRYKILQGYDVIYSLESCEEGGWVRLYDKDNKKLLEWKGLSEMEVKHLLLKLALKYQGRIRRVR